MFMHQVHLDSEAAQTLPLPTLVIPPPEFSPPPHPPPVSVPLPPSIPPPSPYVLKSFLQIDTHPCYHSNRITFPVCLLCPILPACLRSFRGVHTLFAAILDIRSCPSLRVSSRPPQLMGLFGERVGYFMPCSCMRGRSCFCNSAFSRKVAVSNGGQNMSEYPTRLVMD